MNISLTPELEQLVDDKVNTGMYQTASEVIREGLRLLRERDQHLVEDELKTDTTGSASELPILQSETWIRSGIEGSVTSSV